MTEIDKQLAELEELRRNGSITEEEYQRDRARILNNYQYAQNNNVPPKVDTSYLMLMHLSQFTGFAITGLGFILPIILWAVNKDRNIEIDRHGKNIMNFIISYLLYAAVLGIASLVFLFGVITIPLAIVAIVALCVLVILQFIFIILAAVKANSNEFWKYPMTIPFFNVN